MWCSVPGFLHTCCWKQWPNGSVFVLLDQRNLCLMVGESFRRLLVNSQLSCVFYLKWLRSGCSAINFWLTTGFLVTCLIGGQIYSRKSIVVTSIKQYVVTTFPCQNDGWTVPSGSFNAGCITNCVMMTPGWERTHSQQTSRVQKQVEAIQGVHYENIPQFSLNAQTQTCSTLATEKYCKYPG